MVGVDVGDDRDVRPVAAGTTGRSRRPRRRSGRRCRGARWSPTRRSRRRSRTTGRARRAAGDGDHRGGRGLAVGAGDRDRAPAGHRRGQRLGAVQHPQPARAAPRPAPGGRPGSRWSRRRCRRRRGWPARGACGWWRRAPAAPPGPAIPELAAGHRDAAGEQEPGQAAHADPADADQVHRAQLGERRRRGSDSRGDVRRSADPRPTVEHEGRPAPRRRRGGRPRRRAAIPPSRAGS